MTEGLRWADTVEFTRRIQAAQTPQDVCKEMLNLTSRFGLNRLIAGIIPKTHIHPARAKQNILLADWPDRWMHRYVSQGFAYSDPILAKVVSEPGSGFTWAEANQRYMIRPESIRMTNEAREHGLSVGFAVPLVTLEGDIATASFGGERMDLSPATQGLINLVGVFAIGRSLQLQQRMSPTREVMTQRELDVVRWSAEGKTDYEIGIILSIAESTVRSHVRSAISKYGVTNKTALVAEALRSGVIT